MGALGVMSKIIDAHIESVRDSFSTIARDYDKERRFLIPCFDDFYQAFVDAVTLFSPQNTPLRIADLGAGTGLSSAFLAPHFATSSFELIDISEAMLARAKERFAGDSRFEFRVADYSQDALAAQSYDGFVSSLSIHHVADEAKKALFRNVFSALKPGGIFVNADQLVTESAQLDDVIHTFWRRKIAASGLPIENQQAAFVRMALDRPATLEQNLAWIRAAGFTPVECLYKHHVFSVIVGFRS
jgi:tRNA (cmo5U34)-methyltransferase